MIPSGKVRRTLDLLRADAEALASDARQLAREYEEAHDAGLASLRSKAGESSGSARPKGSPSDPTGTSAGAYEYRRIKGASAYAARRIEKAQTKLAGARQDITDALEVLHSAWLDTDPDLAEERRRKREAAHEAVREFGEGA